MERGRNDDKVKAERGQHYGAGSKVSKPEECTVCFMVFEETERRPRTLPCGHTFCSSCIQELIHRGQLTCPTCRAPNFAFSIDDFPISYLTEVLVKRLTATALTQASPPAATTARAAAATAGTERPHKKPEAISKILRALLEEERDNCSSVLKECREVQSQLEQHHTQLAGWKQRLKRLESSLLRLAHRTREYWERIGQEESQVLALIEKGEQEEQEVQVKQCHLGTLTTAGEAYRALDSSGHCISKANNWTQKCCELFPNAELVITSLKVLEATEVVVGIAEKAMTKEEAETGATAAPATLGDPATTIQQRVEALITPPPVVKVQDLKNMKESTWRLVEAGRVMAVHQDGGRRRSSKITVKEGRVYVHALQDQPPPPTAATLQASQLVPAAPPCLVFLDVAWPGSPPQRVHIRLSPDTPLGRQFLLLCTGLQGPSYRGSRLNKVGTSPGGWVEGGAYENDGTGSTALLPNLGQGDYRMCGKEGTVWGWPEVGARFAILIRIGGVFGGVFGRVEGGLHVLKEAAKHKSITEVTLADCGVVLWQ